MRRNVVAQIRSVDDVTADPGGIQGHVVPWPAVRVIRGADLAPPSDAVILSVMPRIAAAPGPTERPARIPRSPWTGSAGPGTKESHMPTRDRAPDGAPCWVDLTTRDVDGARKFYADVFGWTSTDPDPDFGGYFMFSHDGVPIAGGTSPMSPEIPDNWLVYLATPDAAAATARATEHGGEIVAPAMAVATLGTMAIIRDPGGAVVGMWQPDTFPGFVQYAEPGTPQWSEVHTRNFADVAAFYPAVFGWETKSMGDTDEFRYTVATHGEENIAGVMDGSNWLPEGVPSHWTVYFGVSDADATIERIVAGGGSVIMPVEDTPYGRLAAVADPTGAIFRVMQAG